MNQKSHVQMSRMKKEEIGAAAFFFGSLDSSIFYTSFFPRHHNHRTLLEKNVRGEEKSKKISRYVQLHRMNKFCWDHPRQRRTLDKRSDFRDACFWKSFKESGVSSGKYRRWKINADGGTAAG